MTSPTPDFGFVKDIYEMNREVCEHMVPLDSPVPCKKCFIGELPNLLEEKCKIIEQLQQKLSDYKANNNAAKWNKLLAKRMDEIEHLELQVKYYYTAYESEKALCMKVMAERDKLKEKIK